MGEDVRKFRLHCLCPGPFVIWFQMGLSRFSFLCIFTSWIDCLGPEGSCVWVCIAPWRRLSHIEKEVNEVVVSFSTDNRFLVSGSNNVLICSVMSKPTIKRHVREKKPKTCKQKPSQKWWPLSRPLVVLSVDGKTAIPNAASVLLTWLNVCALNNCLTFHSANSCALLDEPFAQPYCC